MELVIGLAGTLAGRNGTTRRPPKRLERRSYALHKGKAFAFPDREAAHRTRTPTVLAHVCGARAGLEDRGRKRVAVFHQHLNHGAVRRPITRIFVLDLPAEVIAMLPNTCISEQLWRGRA